MLRPRNSLKKRIKFTLVGAIAVVLCITSNNALVLALTGDDLDKIFRKAPLFSFEESGCTVVDVGDGVASDGSIWSSGLQPPYILEQFAIETLKALAQKLSTDPSNAVTEEHIIGLVAFMFGEGGDINNNDIFNPLNTGINAPELLATGHSASGLQSFKSFDAGVEATARTMVLKTQSRLGAALTDKDVTAEQFMEALTYYNRYAGNAFWAEASKPPNQDSYYRQRLQLVSQVRTKYADIAGLILGTPDKEFVKNMTDKSKLTYHPTASGGTVSGGTDANCNSSAAGVVAGNIVETARGLAWEFISPGHTVRPGQSGQAQSKPSYQLAMPRYNGSTGTSEFSDCGVFVSTVMIASGADPNYPKRSTSVQLAYVRNHRDKYDIKENVTSADLQPGDILVRDGHTYLFTGAFKGSDGKDYNSVTASLALTSSGHTPEPEIFYQGFTRARLIKTNTGT